MNDLNKNLWLKNTDLVHLIPPNSYEVFYLEQSA